MDFEQFKEFMLQSAAQHDARITAIEESMGRLINTVDKLVDNQVFLQEANQRTESSLERTNAVVQELAKLVIRHISEPGAHSPSSN
ncbi:MAG: hypothetical protein NTZ56_04980 [Acidobacteria bacterium]|nr:hypothetical protein [Acidobacteriota bacterium]